MTQTTRLPPQNLLAEQCVLASIMLMPSCLDDVMLVLRREHFYADRHQKIFAALQRLQERHNPTDAVSVAEELDRANEFSEIGGLDYMTSLMESVPNPAHAVYYANLVRQTALERDLVMKCSEVIKSTYSHQFEGVDELLAHAETEVMSIAEAGQTRTVVSFGEVLMEAWDEVVRRRNNRGALPEHSTGFDDLDRITGGWHGGELIVVAARPGMGKSALVSEIALRSTAQEKSVMLFALEMSREELGMRFLTAQSRVPGEMIKSGELAPVESEMVFEAANELSSRRIAIDDRATLTVAQIAASCRRAKRRGECDLVVIDYLQLIQAEDRRSPREQQIASMTRSLKCLARDLDVPVIVLAQLNREVEHRDDKRPRLSDLRESGAIEQDADVVLFIHRPSAYDPDCRPGEAELIVAKQRNGPAGSGAIITLTWLGQIMRFENFAHPASSPQYNEQPLFN